MKAVFFFAMAMGLGSSAAFATTYQCEEGRFEPVMIEVVSDNEVVINGRESGTIDPKYAQKYPEKSKVKLSGRFSSVGDGEEGYTVDIYVTKTIFQKKATVWMTTYADGPDGFYSENYRCHRLPQ